MRIYIYDINQSLVTSCGIGLEYINLILYSLNPLQKVS